VAAVFFLVAGMLHFVKIGLYMQAMKQHPKNFRLIPWFLWARLPLQAVFIAWVWFASGPIHFSKRLRKIGSAQACCMILAMLSVFVLSGCTGLQLLNATVSHRGYLVTRDIAYGWQPGQKLDVYLPKKIATNAAVVIFFHGGSWRNGSKKDYRFVAQALTSRGFVVVVPDYRVYPQVTFPVFVQDGAEAVRWVRDNIAIYGGDTKRIDLMGHSAGAHIAALLTLDSDYLKGVGLTRHVIRATAALSGPYDFIPNVRDRPAFGMQINDLIPNPNIEPITFVDGQEPPMLLLQGLQDKVVAPSNAANLAARIREKGGEVKYITYPKRGHASVVVALASGFHWLAPVLNDVTKYFDSH
jgi:acetyl esterase/lipase